MFFLYYLFVSLKIVHFRHLPSLLLYEGVDKVRTIHLHFSSRNTSYNVVASSLGTWFFNSFTSTVTIVCPNVISTSSPTATFVEGFATVPFTLIRPCSATCFANGRRLISRDNFRNLSSRMIESFLSFCFLPKLIELF